MKAKRPTLVVDKRYENKKELRGHFQQKGSLGYQGYTMRPVLQRLVNYERVAYQDTTVHTALEILVNSLLTSLGDVTHPDRDIADFLNYNIKRLEDTHNIAWKQLLSNIIYNTLWAGYSVSEVLYDLVDGSLFLDGIVPYHPSTILIRPDKRGLLRENKPTYTGLRSGIYQVPTETKPEVQLPFWKIIYLTNKSTFSNYYGKSIIAPIYKWHLLKEAVVDMMTVALDRFGNPLMYIKMPSYTTGETTIDPSTGIERALTTQDILQEQIENLQGSGNVVFLPQQDGTNKPDIGTLTTGNNIGMTFIESMRFIDEHICRGIGIPYFLLSTDKFTNGGPEERVMEMFQSYLNQLRDNFIPTILRQCFHRIILHNFNKDSNKIAPSFTKLYSDRPEDRVATMQMIRGMTELGYFNPKDKTDFEMARQMVRAPSRELSKADIDFTDDVLLAAGTKKKELIDKQGEISLQAKTIQAKEAAKRAAAAPKPKSSSPSSSSSTKSKPAVTKSTPLSKGGRPTGKVAKQDKARPITQKKPKGDVA